MKILAVYGSTQQESQSLKLADLMIPAAEQQGASVQRWDLLAKPLPVFRTDQDFSQDANVQSIRQASAEADAFILISPEYHGCMSAWLKNFFDFHYHEFAGKLFAVAATTGGSMGISCNTQMRLAIQHCHGWVLPYHTATRPDDFDAQGQLQNAKVRDRLERMARDLVVYGQLLHGQFANDRQAAKEQESSSAYGFAAWSK